MPQNCQGLSTVGIEFNRAFRFRNRLIFPIVDLMGRTVGFGGRALGDDEPKYLNSAESPTFIKGRTLYGLSWAKNAIRRADRVILVEGYFDCVRLMMAGLDEVVAPLGTALAEPQAELLRRYTRNVYLLYDSDPAGLMQRPSSMSIVYDGSDREGNVSSTFITGGVVPPYVVSTEVS